MLVRGGEQALIGRIEALCASTKRCTVPGYVLLPGYVLVIDKHCLSNALGNSLGLQWEHS